jgi:hypothetical protein
MDTKVAPVSILRAPAKLLGPFAIAGQLQHFGLAGIGTDCFSPNQLHAGARGERIAARVVLDLGHQSPPVLSLNNLQPDQPAEPIAGNETTIRQCSEAHHGGIHLQADDFVGAVRVPQADRLVIGARRQPAVRQHR